MFLNGMVGIVRISDCEWCREGVSAWWQQRRCRPKAEFLWVSPPSLLSPSASVKSAFGSFQGFPKGRLGGRGGAAHNGRFQNTQILCSFQLVWVTHQGWRCSVTKCKFRPQYWSIIHNIAQYWSIMGGLGKVGTQVSIRQQRKI